MDTTFTITERDGSTITADALTGDWYTLTRGATATLRFYYDRGAGDTALIVESGETYTVSAGDTETYHEVIVDGTLDVDGTLNVTDSDFGALQDYLQYGGVTSVRRSINHKPTYHDTSASNPVVESQVLKIEPSADLQASGVVGIWALVTGGRDARNSALTRRVLELDCRVLAEASEYAAHTDLEADLQA